MCDSFLKNLSFYRYTLVTHSLHTFFHVYNEIIRFLLTVQELKDKKKGKCVIKCVAEVCIMSGGNEYFRDGAVVLYKRPRSKKWQGRYKIKKGKNSWKRISTGEYDLKLASEIACEKYDEHRFRVKSGLAPDSRLFRIVAEIAKKELQDELDSGYGKQVYSHYIGAIDRYLTPFFNNTHIDSIDYNKLQEFDEYRKKQLGKYPAKSTVNTHNAALRRVFIVAVKNNWMSEYQVPAIINTGKKEKTVRRPYFSEDEYRTLYVFMRKWSSTGRKQLTRDIRTLLRDYVLFVANTGMRPGTETMNLKWNDISEFKAMPNHNQKHPGEPRTYLRMVVSGKTGEREIIARHTVRRYLKRLASSFDYLKDLTEKELYQREEFVFRLPDGTQPRKSTLNNSFRQCLDKCSLLENTQGKRRSLYSLRHTYATLELQRGISVHLLAKQMGTSVQMIEKHYSHLVPSLSADILSGEYW